MSLPRVRIFSDLHFGDPRSDVRDLRSLSPLFAGADEIILNGDTLDTVAPATLDNQNTVRDFFATAAPPATFLTGNHDPDISERAELSLAEGRVWVTHGDVFFDQIAPWSHHAPDLIRRLAALEAVAPPSGEVSLETRFMRHRMACAGHMASAEIHRPHTTARLRRIARTFFPPRRLIAILRAWRDTPRLAASLATTHRPLARVVVLGHTHRPGVWRASGPERITVVNTGSFSRPLGGAFVELAGERLRVVRIDRRGAEFFPGAVLADLALPQA